MKSTAQQLQFCQKEEEALRRQIHMLSSRSRLFIIGDNISFLGIVFFLVLITLSDDSTMRLAEGVMALVMAGVYIVVRNRDVRNSERMASLERLRPA